MYSILCQVGPRDIPAFGDALMAVRATKVVVDHFHKGQLPPNPFQLDSLSADSHEVSFEELRQILNLVHLIRCIEDFCLYNTEWGRDCYFHLKQENKAAPPQENWLKWQERFHRSMYQSFLMGAVLSRAYQQPLDPSNNCPEHFFKDINTRLQGDEPVLRNDEMAYLLRYPVFNFEAYEDHEPIYGQLADFLVQQSRHRAQSRSNLPDFYPEDAIPNDLDRGQASLLYAETVQCLLASMTLLNHEGYSPIFEKDNKNPDIKSLSRKVTIVPLGSFYPEQIAMPTSVHAAHQTRLLKSPLPQETGESSWNPSARFMSLFLDIMHSSSGQPNHYADTFPTPPPPLQIFQFISRKFLGLRFSDEAFDVEDIDAAHKLFVHHPTASGIYEDEWPDLIPSIFDTPDGGGEYDAYYVV
ncbi:predicted protein [Aspergillus nidulans FGSC A4]|uniref:Uncharacterized protein n=1 Tax=Emericella nidulans (strain FGSC A4 / ATCC 38163 / CBS 112.46 / NRRL 194 / M139) TaxID=227321 RepID=Q5AUD9_EMENI|nr:hypothetical protein [Aspergillus nidulans FGSC A4]EAA59713.1 predicted protein [Aspergillus nidulans FGSC A4]CBF73866.1 TPA: conserved hypothetical protein [Aspergillus nidulans FGSC A4]|eukprot:XP_681360.1 predicted protein [Aspergillus nidulans FGSC A4]